MQRSSPHRGRVALALAAALGWAVAASPAAGVAQRVAPRAEPAPPPGWIGFWYEVVVGDDRRPVMVVDRIEAGSPAERAGLGRGDTLLAVDGATVSPAVFRALGLGLRAGDAVRLTLRRDGRRRHVDVTATRRPRGLATTLEIVTDSAHRTLLAGLDSIRTHVRIAPTPVAVPTAPGAPRPGPQRATPFRVFVGSVTDSLRLGTRDLGRRPASRPLTAYMVGQDRVAGARLTPLNEGLAAYFGTGRGLLVVDVVEGTPTEQVGLRPGDVLVAVAGVPVASMDDLRAALARTASRPVSLRVLRKGRTFDVRLP